MERAKCLFILSILFVALSAQAIARVELPEEMQFPLIARAHPELGGIDSLQVAVIPSGAKIDKGDSLWKDLRTKVEQKLRQAGLRIPDPDYVGRGVKPFYIPKICIHIDILKLEDTQQYIFLVRTSLARPVYLAGRKPGSEDFQPGSMLKADVWTKASPMQIAASQHTLPRISQIILEQTDRFIVNWAAANPRSRKATEPNDVAAPQKRQAKPPARPETTEYKYVASKNSKVFHRPDCRFAGTISPRNLVGYKTRNDAINAGKRPCKICRP